MSKYTVNSGRKFDSLVESHMKKAIEICLSIKDSSFIKSIILMGSYGRGEGTALVTDKGLQPFNDYDLVVVGSKMSESKRKKIQRQLKVKELEASKIIGIDVDYFLHTENSLCRADNSLMNYEMKKGHKVIYGKKDILSMMPKIGAIPLKEATRLLLNRGKLLLDIQQTLRKNGFVPDRLQMRYKKFIYKTILALGDAALMTDGLYEIPYTKKQYLIDQISFKTDRCWLIKEYKKAIQFKFTGLTEFLPQHTEHSFYSVRKFFLTFYYFLEGKRLKTDIKGYNSYWHSIKNKKKELSSTSLINFYHNINSLGVKAFLCPAFLLKHPSERLFAAFPLLLKPILNEREREIIHRLEGCKGHLEDGIQCFYKLREKYL